MADVFLSYRRTDRDAVDKIAEALDRLGIDVWYDTKIRPVQHWRRDIQRELAAAKAVVTLWTPEAIASRWVNLESSSALEDDRLISVMLAPCALEAPFSELQAIDLTNWSGDTADAPFLDLLDTIADKTRDTQLRDFVVMQRVRKADNEQGGRAVRRIRHYSFLDLMRLCDGLRDQVREFDPDVFFAFDSRGGLWAEMFFDYLTHRVPVIVGYRLRNTGPRKSDLAFKDSTRLGTGRWDLYVPPAIAALPRTAKILFVDDYSATGDTCVTLKRHLVDTLGFPKSNVKTLTLVTAPDAQSKGQLPDIYGVVDTTEVIDLFYMYRR